MSRELHEPGASRWATHHSQHQHCNQQLSYESAVAGGSHICRGREVPEEWNLTEGICGAGNWIEGGLHWHQGRKGVYGTER
jgi:hypothetical protein